MAFALADILDRPFEARRHFVTISGVVDASVISSMQDEVSFWLTLDPFGATEKYGYPREIVRIVFYRGRGEPLVYPSDLQRRQWEHRNPDGSLCLWYPRDPDELRWTINDPIDTYIMAIQRHLFGEEVCRRRGAWPWEDAPHGERPGGHPITSDVLREVVADV